MKNYDEYQSSRDREYLQAWEQLSPEQRKALADAGVDGPELPTYRTHKPDDEAFVERIAAHDEDDETEACGDAHDLEHFRSALRRLCAELGAWPNPDLTIECLYLVTGICYEGKSMVHIAHEHSVTRAAVSKRCVALSQALTLQPSRAMRKLTARDRYEHRARNAHARHVN